MLFLTAALITLLLTFSFVIGFEGKTLNPSGSQSSHNFCFLLILGVSHGPVNIGVGEVLAGGLLVEEPFASDYY